MNITQQWNYMMMMTVIKNNNNNNYYYNSNNNCNNNSNNNNNNRREWKIQLSRLNSCISTKHVEDKRTIYTKTEPVEIFMVSNTEDVISKLFNTLLQTCTRNIK